MATSIPPIAIKAALLAASRAEALLSFFMCHLLPSRAGLYAAGWQGVQTTGLIWA
ncbi:MAG: hypothetical protein Kow0063_01480 [Anaerolineae bacterium]